MPRVSVRNSVRKPISPRAGTRYSSRTQPVEWLTICSIRPLRSASIWVTTPTYSSGTSIASRSTGSQSLPSISRVTTCGWPAVSSKPSRRISSSRTTSWSSPRPWTSQASGRSVSWTRIETLPTSSWSSRSRIWRAVSFEPSRPASGEVLIPTTIESEGSSTVITGSGRGSSGSARVSPIVTSGRPATAMISPGPGLVGLDPVERLGHVEVGDRRALDRAVGAAPGDRRALADRPVADPAERQAADVGGGVEVGDVRLQRGARGRSSGAGIRSTIRSISGVRSVPSSPSVERRPAGPGVRVDDRELDLVVGGVEVEEELVDLVDDLGDPGVGAVDLVDDEDHRQPRLERLAQDEARLRQRPLGGVDEQQDPVDHRQRPLDLAAEVGVARACRRC